MKKILAVFLCIVFVLGIWGCGTGEDPIVTRAIDEIDTYWTQLYPSLTPNDGHLEIVHTRKITVRNHTGTKLEDIAYIVEFQLITDYYGTAPNYVNTGMNSHVLFYKDGTTEVVSNYLVHYLSSTADFESIKNYVIIENLGDRYNRVMDASN